MKNKVEAISELLAREGFSIEVNDDGEISLTPSVLRLNQIKVKLVKRGRYIADPAMVPEELKDKNILWVHEPPEVTAITLNGEEVPILVEQISIMQDIEHPDDNKEG